MKEELSFLEGLAKCHFNRIPTLDDAVTFICFFWFPVVKKMLSGLFFIIDIGRMFIQGGQKRTIALIVINFSKIYFR
jgi:hypothetical protein